MLAAVVHSECARTVGVRRLHHPAGFVEGVVPVDRHRNLRHWQTRPPRTVREHPCRSIIGRCDQLVRGLRELQHPRDAGVVDRVQRGPVEVDRKVSLEDGLRGLQRHSLVDQRPAAHSGCTQSGHVVAGDCLEQADVRIERNRSPEQVRAGAVPEHPLVRRGRVGEGIGIRPCGPTPSAFEHQNRDACLRQAQRRDTAPEPRSDHDDSMVLTGERDLNPRTRGGLRGTGTRRHGSNPGHRGRAQK